MGIDTYLLDRGLITAAQLAEAMAEQKRTGDRLDHTLLRLGLVSSDDVLTALAAQFHLPIIDLSTIDVDDETLRTLPAKVVFKLKCVPIARSGRTLRVATSDPSELSAPRRTAHAHGVLDRTRARRRA